MIAPLNFLVTFVAGWIQRDQERRIEFVEEQIRSLRELNPGKRIPFTDGQRRRLSVTGRALGRRVLEELMTVVSPGRILTRHRRLLVQEHEASGKRGPHRHRRGEPALFPGRHPSEVALRGGAVFFSRSFPQ